MLRHLPSARTAYPAAANASLPDCNESRDPVDLLEKLRLRRQLRLAAAVPGLAD